MIHIGDILRNKKDGTYATAEYSTFGISVHFWTNEGYLGKTLGDIFTEVEKYWEVVDLPDGYKVHDYAGVVKIE